MKIYRIEFRYFDAASWDYVTKEILSNNIFQLIKLFVYETSYLDDTMYCKKSNKIRKKTRKDLWKEIKIEEIQFPIVREL